MVLIDNVLSARSVRSLVRRFERRHAPTTGRTATFVLAMLGLYVGTGVLWWLFTLPPTVLTTSDAVAAAQPWTPTWGWVVVATAAAAGIALARAVGPVTTSAEFGFWLVSTPLDRGALLRRRVVITLGCGALVGTLVGRIAAFAAELAVWVPFTALIAPVGVGVVTLSILAQCRMLASRSVTGLIWVCLAGSVAAAVAAIAGVSIPLPTDWWPVAAVAMTVMAGMLVAARSCSRIGAADLTAGADTAVALSASATALDPSVLLGALEQKAWRRVGRRRTHRLPGGLVSALIRSDLLRYRRRPISLLLACCAVGVAAVAAVAAPPPAVAVLQLAAVFVVAMIFSAGLRDVCRDRDFGVLLGVIDRQIRLPLTVVPGVAALLAAVSLSLLTGGVATPVIALIGACGGAYRVRTRSSIRYDGLILETALGQIPVDLLRQWLRGPDVLVAAAWLSALLN
ncbi:MAG: DUF6297 family protein [Rhodococcus sp. (in: high G+C Gram-positive bacteria)]|uniref:DUF6297 family protein n=1 Tax=Rhodococcus sp. TaxID=1831 RepID=UPI003BB4BF27